MGRLHYDSRSFEFEDRVLAHVQIVGGVKLRRAECFFLTWCPAATSGLGRQAVWIGVGIPLRFEYRETVTPSINRAWIEALLNSANLGGTLNLSEDRNREPAVTP